MRTVLDQSIEKKKKKKKKTDKRSSFCDSSLHREMSAGKEKNPAVGRMKD